MKVVSSSICRSDLHLLDGGIAEGMILGHGLRHRPDGTPVAVEPMAGCGSCWACDEGHLSFCSNGAIFYGIGLPGGMADEIIVHPDALVALPAGLALEHACLVEPLAVATHALDHARVTETDRVLVIGAFPSACRCDNSATGGSLRSAPVTPQQAAAERLSAALDVGDGYDVVIDAVAASASIGGRPCARPMGRVGLVGTAPAAAELYAACMKEIEILPAMTYRCRVPAATSTRRRPPCGGARHRPDDHHPSSHSTAASAFGGGRCLGHDQVAFDLWSSALGQAADPDRRDDDHPAGAGIDEFDPNESGLAAVDHLHDPDSQPLLLAADNGDEVGRCAMPARNAACSMVAR